MRMANLVPDVTVAARDELETAISHELYAALLEQSKQRTEVYMKEFFNRMER